ncbi:proximal sequence element A Pbp95 [Lasioglossum baleicum]|uniref:proximal sequence element A Pbp95 n=1 Tax=Lasioglossum baleicum TaxID=434251 RepID=UPI003FCD11EC
MDELTDDDDLEQMLSFEIESPKLKSEHDFLCISPVEKPVSASKLQMFPKQSTFQKKPEHQRENMISECSIEDCDKLLNLNKQIISFLLDLKKHITYALEKCETKLSVIEFGLEKHATGDTRALICNAGMPYFKDRNHFFAPNNDDELLKENSKELQLRNLPKVAPWTMKERNTLLKAIQEETVAASIKSTFIEPDESTSESTSESTCELACESSRKPNKRTKRRKRMATDDCDRQVVQLQDKDVDWFNISSVHFENVHSPLDCRVMWNVFLHPRINKNSWTKSEDVKLKEITRRCKYQNWDRIAEELNTNRSAYQCFIRYNTISKLLKDKNLIWKPEEDEKLLKLIKIFQIGNFIPWSEVANWMQNRTKQQMYFRWTYSLAPYLIKGRFSKSEDNILKDAVAKYGTNFRKISAALMPNRSTVQLHDRYQTLTHSQLENWNVWTLEEDLKLMELYERFGPNWSRIAETFTCKTRTKLRHRHAALQRYISKGVSIDDLHKVHSKDKNSEVEQETGIKESNQSNGLRCLNEGMVNKNRKDCNDCNEDIDKELIKYFHEEERIKKSFSHRQQPYMSDELECDVNKLYNILRQLNAQLSIPDDAINNPMLNGRQRQLLFSLKEYTDMKNNKDRQRIVLDDYGSLMFGVNRSNTAEVPSTTKCIDCRVNTRSTLLDENAIDFDTPDVVVSHIGGYEQELEFEKLTRLLVQSRSSEDRRLVRTTKGILDQNYSATNSRDNDNRSSLNCNVVSTRKMSTVHSKDSRNDGNVLLVQTNVRGRKNRSTSCSQSENTMSNLNTLFNAFETTREFPATVEIPKDPYVPAIESTHSTLFSFRRLLGFKQRFNKEQNTPPKALTMSKTCQQSLSLLETRLEQLFKYPIGLSRTSLPEVYVIDTFSYDDITSQRKTSDPPTIPKPRKTRKLQKFNKTSKGDN